MKKVLLVFMLVFFYSGGIKASETGGTLKNVFSEWSNQISNIWYNGSMALIVPVNTWHNRLTYDHSKIKDYNERPWGIGLERYVYDENKDRHGLIAMTFKDSFNKPEPTFLYSYQKRWRKEKDFNPTLGIAAGITFRENYHWLPVPGAAPTFGFDYKSFSLECLYVPIFDVMLTWVTWRF